MPPRSGGPFPTSTMRASPPLAPWARATRALACMRTVLAQDDEGAEWLLQIAPARCPDVNQAGEQGLERSKQRWQVGELDRRTRQDALPDEFEPEHGRARCSDQPCVEVLLAVVPFVEHQTGRRRNGRP